MQTVVSRIWENTKNYVEGILILSKFILGQISVSFGVPVITVHSSLVKRKDFLWPPKSGLTLLSLMTIPHFLSTDVTAMVSTSGFSRNSLSPIEYSSGAQRTCRVEVKITE